MKTADIRNRLAEIDDAGRNLPGYRWGVETPEWITYLVAEGLAEPRIVRGLRYIVLTKAGSDLLAAPRIVSGPVTPAELNPLMQTRRA